MQLVTTLLFGVALPALLFSLLRFGNVQEILCLPSSINTIAGATLAAAGGVFILRKFASFPGISEFSYVLPTFVGTFGLVAAVILLLRIPYSVSFLTLIFAGTLTVSFVLTALLRRKRQRHYHIVSGGEVDRLLDIDTIDYRVLEQPALPAEREGAIVADLHHEHAAEWENLLAHAALQSVPVYHYKQVHEALTGKVQIEHLSENRLGSLIPSRPYVSAKRLLDILFCLAMLPLLAIPSAIVALAIRLESPGPALFRQVRVGYRGQRFRVVKFRTMHVVSDDRPVAREHSMTQSNDRRITRLGRLLRRTRIDEIPQIINILRGEMSLIGPRPEALSLSEWYRSEIPFYDYRHIVRPGITGWAQVNQGHVTELELINTKLQYDFFYIKNFSFWLDILICVRTCAVVVSGFGSK